MNSDELFLSFVAAINRHDVEGLLALMSADHLFVDSQGNRVAGAAPMEVGWRGYFAMCPDYWIRIETIATNEDVALASGEAGGTVDGEAWRTPAAWKGVFGEGKVKEWRVFADNKQVVEILARRQWR